MQPYPLIVRAITAFYRSGGTEQPSGTSGERTVNGRRYVVLENVNGTLAVYRVRSDGMLKRMRRWPAELETAMLPFGSQPVAAGGVA